MENLLHVLKPFSAENKYYSYSFRVRERVRVRFNNTRVSAIDVLISRVAAHAVTSPRHPTSARTADVLLLLLSFAAPYIMREIVHIQAGQCGNQVRTSLSLRCDLVTCDT